MANRFIMVWLLGSALSACISHSSGGSGSGGGGAARCFQNSDGECRCVPAAHGNDAEFAGMREVTMCGDTLNTGIVFCEASLNDDGTASSCICWANSCSTSGSTCSCDYGRNATAACTGYQWCCVKDDNSSCYCGNGNAGSGCGNGEHPSASCTQRGLRTPTGQRTTCAGLFYADPPPAPGGGGGGGGSAECTVSVNCSSRCSGNCYRCSSGSCQCGRRGVSGACLY